MTIDEILKLEESQTYDRKSINIKATDLAQHLCAFANADGGIIVIGISDKTKTIEGVDYNTEKVNDLLRAAIDYCKPSVHISPETVPCIDSNDKENHVLVLHIDASTSLHANQVDDVYLRVGDKSKKLSFNDRLTLMYDKGLRLYENTTVADSDWEDIDFAFLNKYLKKIGYGKTGKEYLLQNKEFAYEKNGTVCLNVAAILLFGNSPQKFFPRARIRFIRYDGCEAKTGSQMNVIKDVLFEGSILKQTQDAIAFIKTQIKERTYLGADGVFVTESEYPEFVLTELIVNAVTHRDYSIIGTEIQIRMFDDRIEVDSPGKLPGMVKPENIRFTHFSRNPTIAEFMKQYEYVKEYGEGVDRIYQELESHGLPELKINTDVFLLKITAYNHKKSEVEAKKSEVEAKRSEVETKKSEVEILSDILKSKKANRTTIEKLRRIYAAKGHNVFTSGDLVKILGCVQSTASKTINDLRDKYCVIEPDPNGAKDSYCIINVPEEES